MWMLSVKHNKVQHNQLDMLEGRKRINTFKQTAKIHTQTLCTLIYLQATDMDTCSENTYY